jgi:hypothetical protein
LGDRSEDKNHFQIVKIPEHKVRADSDFLLDSPLIEEYLSKEIKTHYILSKIY